MPTEAGSLPLEFPPGRAPHSGTQQVGSWLDAGHEALEQGNWNAARTCFSKALAVDAGPEPLHGMARAVEWAGDFDAAIRYYEAAYAAYRRRGEVRAPAVIAARELAFLHAAVYGNEAAAAGWLARGIRLAREAGECSEAGWVDLACCLAADSPDRLAVHAAAAAATARRLADPDLEFCALSYEGLGLVLTGKVADGMRRIDEAAAAATAGEVRDYQAVGEIYCKMLLCSEMTLDVRRAEEWIGIATAFGHRNNALWIPAICGMHYGSILVAAGQWEQAEHRLAESLADYHASFRALRSGTAARLADLRIRQGLLPEAAALLHGAGADPAAVVPLARLELSRGQPEAAATRIRRALDAAAGVRLVAPELAALAEALLCAGRRDEAARTGRRLRGLASVTGLVSYQGMADYVLGLAALDGSASPAPGPAERGRAGAGGVFAKILGNIPAAADTPPARRHFENARLAFESVQLPLEANRSRLMLACALATCEPGAAAAEARAALAAFEQLGARSDADAAASLLRRLGHRGRPAKRRPGPLTTRENEVFRLIAEGLTNEEIARRLFISKRTVEHHVGSILAKLGAATRGAALARAAQSGQPGSPGLLHA